MFFLEHGADVNTQNKNGLTPFRLASQGRLAEVIRVLVQHGADSDATATCIEIAFWGVRTSTTEVKLSIQYYYLI